MNEKPLSCTIKNAVPMVADGKTEFPTGCKIIDITFPSIVNPEAAEEDESVGEIRFKNYYVAFITIKAKIKLTEKTPREGPHDQGWRMAVRRFKLMPDPHAETGSQDCYSLSRKHLSCDLNNVVSLRLILQQPSPLWKDFKIEDLKIFKTFTGSRGPPLPTWVMEDEKKVGKKELEEGDTKPEWMQGVPDLNALSSNLQQLWALAEEAAANQTDESLGRYEVDGCYDINLLAYS